MSLERRLTALEKSRPEPQPKRKPEDLEALIQWHVEQFQFAKAAGIAGISEEEALGRWGADYLALQQKVVEQRDACQAFCVSQNAKQPQVAAEEPEKEQLLPPELQNASPELRFDRRRWRDLKRRKRKGIDRLADTTGSYSPGTR